MQDFEHYFNSFDFVLNTMVVMVVCEAASAIAST